MSDSDKNFKKDYWIKENLAFSQVHFRLEKCANIVNSIANGTRCDLLDLGCGPAALARLLHANINYFGIDIAIQDSAPNLLEKDLLESEVGFRDKNFDIIVASGFFEYMGDSQCQKFNEIRKILKDGGTFVVTYSNINHRDWHPDQPWNNVQTIEDFKRDLRSYFLINRFFGSSHNRRYYSSTRRIIRNIQMNLNVYIPIISPKLALEYFLICSKKD